MSISCRFCCWFWGHLPSRPSPTLVLAVSSITVAFNQFLLSFLGRAIHLSHKAEHCIPLLINATPIDFSVTCSQKPTNSLLRGWSSFLTWTPLLLQFLPHPQRQPLTCVELLPLPQDTVRPPSPKHDVLSSFLHINSPTDWMFLLKFTLKSNTCWQRAPPVLRTEPSTPFSVPFRFQYRHLLSCM